MNLYRKYFSQLVLTIVLLSLIPAFAEAQRDTTGTAARTDSIIEYLTPLEYAFMMHEETRFMLRLPAIGVGGEVEIIPYFTLMGQVFYRQSFVTYDGGPVLNGEVRWYYGSKKQGVRNMSGNYVALGYERTTIFGELNSVIGQSESSNLFYGRWGVQRRFLGSGLIDFGLNAGLVQMPESRGLKNNGLFIQATGQVGLGIVFNNEKALDPERLCSVVKCYEKETFLLKLNTTNLFSIYHSTTINNNRINIQPQIALEQKIFDTPFAIQVGSKLDYNWLKIKYYAGEYDGATSKSNFGFLNVKAQARYYYNLKSRIRKGKSGNGLSANYISGGYYKEFYMQKIGNENIFSTNFEGIMLTTGVQRTFGKQFFFDVEFGGVQQINKKYNDFQFYGNLQLGIKF